MDFVHGKRYVVSSNSGTNKSICRFVGKAGDSYKFQVIGSISSYERSYYNINTKHKDGKVLKYDYDDLNNYYDPVSVYPIDD